MNTDQIPQYVSHYRDEETGFVCLIRVNPLIGGLLGYVGLPPSHPWYGKDYSEPEIEELSVHGGVTFSNTMNGSDFWWIGFDCCHAGDTPFSSVFSGLGSYRDSDFVKAELRELGRQIAGNIKQIAHEKLAKVCWAVADRMRVEEILEPLTEYDCQLLRRVFQDYEAWEKETRLNA